MEKQIEIEGKKFLIKEIKYIPLMELAKLEDKGQYAQKLLELSGLSIEEINNLTAKEGNILVEEINKLNGFVGFQTPQK